MDIINITDVQAADYLKATEIMRGMGIEEQFAAPYTVMVKGYNDDWDNYSELTLDDLDNDNVVDSGYEDYELWLNDSLANAVRKGVL